MLAIEGIVAFLCQFLWNRCLVSILLGFVELAIGKNGRTSEVISHQFKILIGDGRDTNFWKDDWTKRGSLRQCYLRIFVLAISESNPMTNFGS